MAIDFVDKQDLERIINYRSNVCISLYLPMTQKGRDVKGNAVQLKNKLQEVTEALKAQDWRQSQIDELLEQPRTLIDDSSYWQQQHDGLALFIAPGFYETFRLPMRFESLTVIANRFHVKPLLPLVHGDAQFYVLALSQKKVRLFYGSPYTVDEIDLGKIAGTEIPAGMAEALAYDDPEEQLQHHTTTSGSEGGPEVVHHGHGIEDEQRLRQRRFLQQVANGLEDFLDDKDDPLVLASVEYLHPMFEDVFRLPNLVDEGIYGNPENISAEELRDRAWEIVQPRFAEAREEARIRFKELSHSEQATDDLHTIVPAAFQGRVDALFVALNEQSWGHYDPETNDVVVHEGEQLRGEDLLDFAAIQTLANGGTVFAVDRGEVPGQTSIAAVFRF